MIIQSKNVKALLETLLAPVSIDAISFKTNPLQSSILLASSNGSVLSFANSSLDTNQNETRSVNNLKMMSLLIRDKWSEDEKENEDQPKNVNATTNSETNNRYNYEINTEKNETLITTIYTYEIEDLHACVSQVPQSDLLLLFIADASYPYGLLVIKMKKALIAFNDMYGYKLG